MPRPKKRGDEWLPAGVTRGKSSYVLRYYVEGKRREIPLCPLDAPRSTVLKRYEDFRSVGTVAANDTLKWLCDQYLKSEQFKIKKPNTQRDYRLCYEQVVNAPLRNGSKFGDVKYAAITTGAVQKYIDSRHKAKTRANRERSFLSIVFAWGIRRDLLKHNPVKAAQGYSEQGRTLYVDQSAYDFVYEQAKEAPWYIRPAMEIAYLCRMRSIEVFDLRRLDILDDGLDTRRTKGSKDAVTLWSPRLRAAVDMCKAQQTGVASREYLFADRRGQQITLKAFRTAWGRLMRRAMKDGLSQRFTFHDLKARGVSNVDGDKQAASGHRSAAMVARYDRKKKRVEATE